MSNYLDVNKSVIISSPAGSGKTEKLARRYIALLQAGVDIERILAITFTDKAAAEMKQRILKILKQEDKGLFDKLLENMSLMRVSTIHSFCGTLLRRFSFEAEIDPNYTIEDAIDSRIMWDEILYEVLMEVGTTCLPSGLHAVGMQARSRSGEVSEGHDLLLQTLSEKGFKGFQYLKSTINNLFEKRPFSLNAAIHRFSFSPGFQTLTEELREWPGAKEAINGYDDLFKHSSLFRFVSAEKYFLTKDRKLRKKVPVYLRSIVDYRSWASKMFLYWYEINSMEAVKKAERFRNIFNRCLDKYNTKKSLKGFLDFNDLEYISFKLLTENPEWINILYAFDEKTDHILVDEFQDTNDFQWAIIDMLTEEWRSGLGSKREEGIMPTIFLVGDEKQSIYLFRGANVEIFQKANKKLKEWLKSGYCFEDVKENFRSLPAIIDFTNHIFSKIMSAGNSAPSWLTRYSSFKACRTNTEEEGRVELILFDDKESTAEEARRKEADILARRIQSLTGKFLVTDEPISNQSSEPEGSSQRLCKYMDIALLLRKRTHLKRYEEAFRKYGIPFVAVKGIGFYQEPEVTMLRALVYFLSNPKDNYSLYILLKSPFFAMDEGSIVKAVNEKGGCLFDKLKNMNTGQYSTLKFLQEWLSLIHHTPVSELIEKALIQTKAWRFFYEAQRRANVKKFIRLVEDLEAEGKSLVKIRDYFERTDAKADEPKANVNTEGMDAVKIMTIHGAKGLEFPIVFLPGLDETFPIKTDDSILYDSDGRIFFKYVPEAAIRRKDEDFLLKLKKEEEEQKRLFYVAVTRAEDALFLVSRWDKTDRGFLGFLKQGLGLRKTERVKKMDDGRETIDDKRDETEGERWEITEQLKGFSIVTDKDVEAMHENIHRPLLRFKADRSRPAEFIPLKVEAPVKWKAVTETVDIKRQHGKDWLILGDIIHKIFEEVSKGNITEQDIGAMAEKLLVRRGIFKEHNRSLLTLIEGDIELLKGKGIWQDIIMPGENSFSELPFILDLDGTVYTGRIDRVIKRDGIYNVYDYKTFPADEKEMGYLLKGYSSQLRIYREAVRRLFKSEGVKSFIVFSHMGEVREVV